MERLAGIDAAFLYLETPSAHMHIAGTVVLDPREMPGGYSMERITRSIVTRLRSLPVFGKRVVETPLGLDHPVLVDDPSFREARHVRRLAAPAPGSPRELAAIVGWIASKPLDRRYPLWELWTVEGLENQHVALVMKVHHALVDGVSGTDVMAHLFDLEADTPVPETHAAPVAERQPSSADLVRSALPTLAAQPLMAARVAVETGRSLASLLQSTIRNTSSTPRPALPFTAPRTSLSRAISPDRAVAFGQADLADVRLIKQAFGTTVNDVILAGCTLALRRYLQARDELPDRPLVATVPVSVHAADGERQLGNRVSALFVGLPVQLGDPVAQLIRINRDTRNAKALHRRIGPNMLSEWAQLAPGGLLAGAARLYSRMRLAERMLPIHNLVVSNVPGPPVPLYVAGARVVAAYPLGPVMDGAAVNISVLSYRESVDFGVISCAESVPDPWEIASGFDDAIRDLRHRAERELRRQTSGTELGMSA